jgi:hypothetical protein
MARKTLLRSITYIQEQNGQLQALTEKELLLFVKENFDKTLTKRWVDALFLSSPR